MAGNEIFSHGSISIEVLSVKTRSVRVKFLLNGFFIRGGILYSFCLYFNMQLTKTQVKYLHSLSQKKIRSSEQKFILEGWRPLVDALASDFKIELIAVTEEQSADPRFAGLADRAREKKIPFYSLSNAELKYLSETVHPQGVLALVEQRRWTFDGLDVKSLKRIVACDAVTDPGNMGNNTADMRLVRYRCRSSR